jgi:hypothetical protein
MGTACYVRIGLNRLRLQRCSLRSATACKDFRCNQWFATWRYYLQRHKNDLPGSCSVLCGLNYVTVGSNTTLGMNIHAVSLFASPSTDTGFVTGGFLVTGNPAKCLEEDSENGRPLGRIGLYRQSFGQKGESKA